MTLSTIQKTLIVVINPYYIIIAHFLHDEYVSVIVYADLTS